MKIFTMAAILLSAILPVQADSAWLVLVLINPQGPSMTKIEMKDLDQCNEQGALYVAHQAIQPEYR